MLSLSNFLKRKLSVKDALMAITIIFSLFFLIKIISGVNATSVDVAPPCDTCGIGITDLVRRVKKELIDLENSMAKNNENALFQLRDMEMEISFIVKQNTHAKAGANYELVTVEGGVDHSNEKVQKLLLHWDAEKPKKTTSRIVSDKPLDTSFINSLK